MSDGLVAGLGSPPGQPTPVGVQPGTTPGISLAQFVIVFGPGAGGGVFLYSGTPALGNPPVAWMTLASQDPYKNPVQPGIFLAELASAGNALGGLLWNTFLGSEPLLALFPDSTLGFAGNAPFILGRVWRRGTASEGVSLALGGGASNGAGSPVMLELFGLSKDGTTQLNQLYAYYPLYIQPPDGNTYRTGHLVLPSTATPAAPQTIASTSAEIVAGCTANVGIGTYRFKAVIQYAGNQAAGTANFQIGLGSGAAATVQWGNMVFFDAVAGTSGYVARPTALSPFGSPALSVNNWMATLDGLAIFTAAGAVSLQAFCSVAADTFAIKNAYLDLEPCS